MRQPTPLPDPLDSRAFTVAEGRASGVGSSRLRGRDLRAPHRSVRVPMVVEDTFEERCRAIATIMSRDQFFTHLTAARLWGVPLGAWCASEPLHVASRAPKRAPRIRGVVGHQVRDERMRVVRRNDVAVVDPESCWLQLCGRLRPEELVAAADHLVHVPHFMGVGDDRPHTTREQLGIRLASHHGRGRRDGFIALSRSRDGVASPQETRLRLLLVDSGLPEPVTDVPIGEPVGTPAAWLDLYYPGLRLAVEYDGQHHRTDDRQYSRDVARIAWLHDSGYSVVRVDKFALEDGGARAVAMVRSRMLALGWPTRSAL